MVREYESWLNDDESNNEKNEMRQIPVKGDVARNTPALVSISFLVYEPEPSTKNFSVADFIAVADLIPKIMTVNIE